MNLKKIAQLGRQAAIEKMAGGDKFQYVRDEAPISINPSGISKAIEALPPGCSTDPGHMPIGGPRDHPGRFVERLSVKIPQQHGFRPGVGGTFNLRENLGNIPLGIRMGFGLGQPGRPAPTNRQMRIAIPALSGPAAVADNIKIKRDQLWDAIQQQHMRDTDRTYDEMLKGPEEARRKAGLRKIEAAMRK